MRLSNDCFHCLIVDCFHFVLFLIAPYSIENEHVLCVTTLPICHSYFRYTRSLMHEAEIFVFYLLHRHTRLRSMRANRAIVKTTTISNSLKYQSHWKWSVCIFVKPTTLHRNTICYAICQPLAFRNFIKFHQNSTEYPIYLFPFFKLLFFPPKLKFGYT